MINKDATQRTCLCYGVLILCSLVIVLSRLHTYYEPLERDITSYEIIGNELLQGKDLYSDIWDHKPPACHLTYAIAIAIAGYGERSVYLLGVVAAILTMLGIYSAGKMLAGNSLGGVWAASFWTIISGDLHLQANQPNVEVFINAVIIWAFAAMLRSDERSSPFLGWFWIGILFAVGSLYKQSVIAPAILLSLVHIFHTGSQEHARRRAVSQVAVAGLVGAGAWCAVLAYFRLRGSLDDFIYAVFTFNRYYSGSIVSNLSVSCAPAMVWPGALRFTWPLALLSLAAASYGVIQGDRRRWMLFIALCASAHIMMAMPGRFFPHYYQYWLPPLALGGGSAIGVLMKHVRGGKASSSNALGAMVMALLLFHEIPFYMLSPEEWSRRKYFHPNENFVGAKRCAREINALLSENETFYEWGSDTGLYFYSRRRPPADIFFHYAMFFGPGGASLEKRLLSRLEAEMPALLVVNVSEPVSNGIREWMQAHYIPCAQKRGCNGFAFLVRRGSDLERRRISGSVSAGAPSGTAASGGE